MFTGVTEYHPVSDREGAVTAKSLGHVRRRILAAVGVAS
jgi:hypothetical protein